MDMGDILIDMEMKPRGENRRNPSFVESVDWELRREMSGGIATSAIEARNLFVLAATRGVYIDFDLGTRDVISYLANCVLYFGSWSNAPDRFDCLTVIRDADELRMIADKALFIAGCMPDLNRREGIGKDFYAFAGKEGYKVMCAIDTRRQKRRRFRELANNFRHYADALEHTAREYLWR